MKVLIIHILLALTWLFLSQGRTMFDLFMGAVLGFAILYVFQSVLSTRGYILRVLGFFRWFIIFLREFIVSNLHVAWIILSRSGKSIEPRFIEMDVSDLREEEMIVLSQTITLTPGTCAVELEVETGKLLVHILDATDPEAVADSIKKNLREPLLQFTRSHG
ncbi:MAG: Na+/H+ antiporter subunit E [Opitutales bacterium]|nr:Na+/H+ antiporter subunit E [Opitutales bacterium]